MTKLLIVDDSALMRKLMRHVLAAEADFEVFFARDGAEGLEQLVLVSPDVVTLDIQMPVMDGYTATQRIRGELGSDIPIIAMTATALIGEQVRCFEVGMNDYMTKPFEFTDLYRRILALSPPVLTAAS